MCSRRIRTAAWLGETPEPPAGRGVGSGEEPTPPVATQGACPSIERCSSNVASTTRQFPSECSREIRTLGHLYSVCTPSRCPNENAPRLVEGEDYPCERIDDSGRIISPGGTTHGKVGEGNETDFSVDLPLLYASCVILILLFYFIIYVDLHTTARIVAPVELHTRQSLQVLDKGVSLGASVVVAFFVWLVHALLYDVSGMWAGVLPAAVTLVCTCAFRLVSRSSGLLALEALSITFGLYSAHILDSRRRRNVQRSSRALYTQLSTVQ